MIELGPERTPWDEETSCQENSTPHLTQNLKALGSWVTSLIKLSPHPYLTNVGLQLHTFFFSTISTSSEFLPHYHASPQHKISAPCTAVGRCQRDSPPSLTARKISTQGAVTMAGTTIGSDTTC